MEGEAESEREDTHLRKQVKFIRRLTAWRGKEAHEGDIAALQPYPLFYPKEYNMDIWVMNGIQRLQHPFLDVVMPWITTLGNSGLLWIGIAVLLLFFPSSRRVGWTLLLALLGGLLLGEFFLKPLIARVRPFEMFPNISLLVSPPGGYSFPSGHTLSSFIAATVLYEQHRLLGVAATIFAFLIAFSRLYLQVHYATDVLAGMALGIFIGWIARKISQRISVAYQKNK